MASIGAIDRNPFLSRWRSMTAARPHLDAYTTRRLWQLLNSPAFQATQLRLAHFERVGRGKYYSDLELLLGNKLAEITNGSPAERRKVYLEKMAPAVEEIFGEVLDGQRKIFPNGFWAGLQGQLNLIICFRYLLEQELGITMSRSPRTIDPRLHRRNQGPFLSAEVGKEDWTAFCAKYKLAGGLTTALGNSFSRLIRSAYPWAFNLNSNEGNHLHPDDFRTNETWQGRPGEKLAWRMVDHRFRRHLGLTMDAKTQTFDPRLLRENQAELLAELGQTCWRDVFFAEGLGSILACRPEFNHKPGQVLKWRYPWAFDWTKPEGQHLHVHDFADKAVFVADHELREALLHEIEQEGWAMADLPGQINNDWLAAHGLGSLRNLAKIDIFRRAFAPEFARGFYTEADFRNQNSTRWLRASAYRRIKETSAGNATYGVIQSGKTAYYFPAELIGSIARIESSDHGVVYKVRVTIHDQGQRGQNLLPVNVFDRPAEQTNYWRPTLSEFDQEAYPILPRRLRDQLIELGVAPQSLTLELQKQLLAHRSIKGDHSLQIFLVRCGLISRAV